MNNLEEWLDKLKCSGRLIIVEGIKDKRALELFGIKDIVVLNKKAIFEVVEEVAGSGREVIILTDLDREGKELFGRLNSGLDRYGVKVDNRFREFLFKETKLRQIEGLVNYLNKS